MTDRKKLLLEITLNLAAVALLFLLMQSRGHITVGQMQTRAAAIADAKKTAPIAAREDVPSVRIDINRASDTGWNVALTTEKFGFATDADTVRYVAKGFVHLLIDGRSVTRMDSRYHYIPFLENGDHVVTVIFEDRNGKAYAFGGKPVMKSVQLHIAGNNHVTTAL